MKEYKLYMDNKDEVYKLALAERYFEPGFTVFGTVGSWHGVKEPAMVLEVVSKEPLKHFEDYAKEVLRMTGSTTLITSKNLEASKEVYE